MDFKWENNEIGEILNAGYCPMVRAITLVRTENEKVNMYQLNSNENFEFLSELSASWKNSKIYSINESNFSNSDYGKSDIISPNIKWVIIISGG